MAFIFKRELENKPNRTQIIYDIESFVVFVKKNLALRSKLCILFVSLKPMHDHIGED